MTDRVTLHRLMPWEYWLDTARRDRTAARREYRAAKRCDGMAERAAQLGDNLSSEWWAERAATYRDSARWYDRQARRAIKHVRDLWPHAAPRERAR